MFQNFEFNLSKILAHSMVFFYKEECPYDFKCQDDPEAPSTQANLYDMLTSLQSYLPGVTESATAQVMPTEEALVGAAESVYPRYADLSRDIYGKNLEAVLGGARAVDPALYGARDAIFGNIGTGANVLNEMLTSPITGGELTAIERGLNRVNIGRGLYGGPKSSTETISNALTFGGAARDRVSQALQLATGFVPAAGSALSPFQVNPLSITESLGTVKPPQLGQAAFGLAQNVFGESGESKRLENELNASRREGWEKLLAASPNVSV